MPPTRRILLALALVLVVVGVLLAVLRPWAGSSLTEGVDRLPASTLRVSFTDWARVRDRLGAEEDMSGPALRRFMDRAYDRDLSAASSVDEAAVALRRSFGFSPANADWEAFGQSRQGATMVMRLADSVDMAGIEERLARLGFDRPAADTGVWDGGVDLVAAIDPTISPELQYVVVLADERLVVTSDTHDYAATAARAAAGEADSLADVAGVVDLVGDVEDPAAAFLWSRDFACEDLAMAQADGSDQRRADQLVRRAGGVNPLSGLLMSMRADRTLDVVLGFEDADRAEADLRPRAELAVGEAVGRSGAFPDILRLTRSRTDGSDVVLTFRPADPAGFVLSEVSSGPVLFATC